jgi:S1-C subfamily serine protease
MSYVEELSRTTRAVLATTAASVVSIGSDGRGCGFVVGDDRVVTNAHHLHDRTTSVHFADGRVAQGRVAGADVDGDLVVLHVDTAGAPALGFAERTPEPGDVVVTVSRDHEAAAVTTGQVSAVARSFTGPRGRRVRGGVEHTAPLRRGSSGGPLLDVTGAVVGVNTHRLPGGFYIARAVDEQLRDLIGRLGDGQSVQRPRLGVAVAPSEVTRRLRRSVGLPEVDGLLVRQVDAGGPAAAAGIAVGDVLLRAGSVELTRPEVLLDVLAAAGEVLELRVLRGVDERDVTVTVRPAADDSTASGSPAGDDAPHSPGEPTTSA